MVRLGEVPLLGAELNKISGAAFLLSENPSVSRVEILESSWEIEIRTGSPYITVRTETPIAPPELVRAALENAHQGLDILAVSGIADLGIRSGSDERVMWWRDQDGQHLRIVTTSVLNVSTSVSLEHRDQNGNVIPPSPTPPISWNESYRFFRLAQLTDDLFDAYRNVWLAFENAVSSVCPTIQGEREGDWLRRALTQISQRVDLSRRVINPTSNPVNDFIQEQYLDTRVRLFHAKHGRSRLRPQELDDLFHVQASLERLYPAYLDIAREFLGLHRGGGVMTYAGFESFTKGIRRGGRVLVSADTTPVDRSETLDSAPWHGALSFPQRHSPDLSRPGLVTLLGVTPAEAVKKFGPFRRIGISVANAKGEGEVLFAASVIEAPLALEGPIDVFEVQNGIELLNVGQPKLKFTF